LFIQEGKGAFPGLPVIIGGLEASCAVLHITIIGKYIAPLRAVDSGARIYWFTHWGACKPRNRRMT
jgi:hypothetical protein